jgi:putative endonuclease
MMQMETSYKSPHPSLRGARRRSKLVGMEHRYFVYILTNGRHTVLYTGITNDLARRVAEHRDKAYTDFTHRYNVHKLVYFEEFSEAQAAIAREKQIKGGSRAKKVALINTMNAQWRNQRACFVAPLLAMTWSMTWRPRSHRVHAHVNTLSG